MRYARTRRAGLTLALGAALWAGSTGCTHNYYYGAVPVCPPSTAVSPSGVPVGSVCEVPTQVVGGGTVVAGSGPQTLPALGGPRPPRVVVSDSPGGNRLAWRRADPDAGTGLATTRVDGAVDDPTLTK